MSAIELTWPNGAHARILESDGDRAVVESETAAAPGTPLTFNAAIGEATSAKIQIKVRGCKKIADEPVTFRIEGRFMNLSAALRGKLLERLGGN